MSSSSTKQITKVKAAFVKGWLQMKTRKNGSLEDLKKPKVEINSSLLLPLTIWVTIGVKIRLNRIAQLIRNNNYYNKNNHYN